MGLLLALKRQYLHCTRSLLTKRTSADCFSVLHKHRTDVLKFSPEESLCLRGEPMRRREFIALISGVVAAWPLAANAQQAKEPTRIGLLPFGSPSNAYDQSLVEAFRSGLRQAGLIEGRDIVLDIVWTSGSDADTDKAVAELIRRGAELLVPTGSTASVAAKRHTSTMPIVFISVGNPVAMGLVENLAHPGGNATGFSDIFSDLSAKLVELGKAVNKQDTLDYLWHTAWPDGKNRFRATEQAAQSAQHKVAGPRNSRKRRDRPGHYGNEAGRRDDDRRSTEPFHLSGTRSYH